MFITHISVHFICYAFFILCTAAASVTPSFITLTKVAIISYISSDMATFASRYPLLSEIAAIQPVGTAIMKLDIISIIFSSIAVIFFLMDYFYLNNNVYNINKLDMREKKYNTNYDDVYQRNYMFYDIKGGRKKDESYDIIYKN